MLTLLHDLPSTVVGVKATGTVSKEDYETVLLPALYELYRRTDQVSLLLQLETELHNYTTGAWLEDLGIGMRYFGNWRKVAIVSRNKRVRWVTNNISLFVPGKYKGFLLEDLVEAKRWVSS